MIPLAPKQFSSQETSRDITLDIDIRHQDSHFSIDT